MILGIPQQNYKFAVPPMIRQTEIEMVTEQTMLDQVEMFIYIFRIAGPIQANSQHPHHAQKNVREEALS